jgi:hypothetical protein
MKQLAPALTLALAVIGGAVTVAAVTSTQVAACQNGGNRTGDLR